MFRRIKLRLHDMKTISQLISGADEQANLLGEQEPGAEHFVLSALQLPDGTAKQVFKRLNTNPDDFLVAIKRQYTDALSSVGVDPAAIAEDPEPIESNNLFHNSQPSGQAVMKLLYQLKKDDKHRPILGAHVIAVVAEMEFGVVPRALKAMGVERDQLSRASLEELNVFSG